MFPGQSKPGDARDPDDYVAHASTSFKVAPGSLVDALGAPFNGVTVITHWRELGLSTGDANLAQRSADGDYSWYARMADMVVEASGGGVALWYDKKTGDWLDPLTGKRNADALQPGKAVVLLSDWKKESDITDSGFAEAAAEDRKRTRLNYRHKYASRLTSSG